MSHDPDIRWVDVEFPGLTIVKDDRFDRAVFTVSDLQAQAGGVLFPCQRKGIVPGAPLTTVMCRDLSNPETTHVFDPLALHNGRLGLTLEQLDPPPDFVRLSVILFRVDHTFGGAEGCQSLDVGLGGCLPPIDGYFDYDVEADGLYFPFDVVEETRDSSGDQIQTKAKRHHDCPSGGTPAHISVDGPLRRLAGLEGGYEGTRFFNNVGMDVLIPWDEYRAMDVVSLVAQGHDLNYITTRTNFSTFTIKGTALAALAYRRLRREPQGTLAVLPGPPGARRRKHVSGKEGPPLRIG